MDNDLIGKKFTNRRGLEYTVIAKLNKKNKYGRYMYLIEFIITKSRKEVTKYEIVTRSIRDYYDRHTYNIGYIGDINVANPKQHQQEHILWRNMLSRCYNKKDIKNYPYYGQLGVTVCERWQCFQYFLEDIINIDGYNENEFKQHLLVLDKDLKQKNIPLNKRIYSKNTCIFISNTINTLIRDTKQYTKKFIAISPDNQKLYIDYGIVNFCKKYKLTYNQVFNRLKTNSQKLYKGWKFINI